MWCRGSQNATPCMQLMRKQIACTVRAFMTSKHCIAEDGQCCPLKHHWNKQRYRHCSQQQSLQLTLYSSKAKKSMAFWGPARSTFRPLPRHSPGQPSFAHAACKEFISLEACVALAPPGPAFALAGAVPVMACRRTSSKGAVAVLLTAPAVAPATR